MSCQDALYVAGIALLASSIASFAAAAWAYRALDIRGAKADLAGTRAGGGSMPGRIPVPRRVRLAASLRPRRPVAHIAAAMALADETTAPLAGERAPRFLITRKDIVAASDRDMESDWT